MALNCNIIDYDTQCMKYLQYDKSDHHHHYNHHQYHHHHNDHHIFNLLTKIVVLMWNVPGACWNPLPGTQDNPVSFNSSKQYKVSGSLFKRLASAIKEGGNVIIGKEYIAPIVRKLERMRNRTGP